MDRDPDYNDDTEDELPEPNSPFPLSDRFTRLDEARAALDAIKKSHADREAAQTIAEPVSFDVEVNRSAKATLRRDIPYHRYNHKHGK